LSPLPPIRIRCCRRHAIERNSKKLEAIPCDKQ
jgi:hypothetical protein